MQKLIEKVLNKIDEAKETKFFMFYNEGDDLVYKIVDRNENPIKEYARVKASDKDGRLKIFDELVDAGYHVIPPVDLRGESELDEALSDLNNNISAETIKRIIIKEVEDYGYQKGYTAYNHISRHEYPVPSPTATSIINKIKEASSDSELSSEMCSTFSYSFFMNWLHDLQPAMDYQHKAKQAWLKDTVDPKEIALLASLVSVYSHDLSYRERQRKRQERDAEIQSKVQSSGNVFVGNVGDAIQFDVDTASKNSYGVWTLTDAEGHTFVWFPTSVDYDFKQGDHISGKIKKQTEFRGLRQNVLGGRIKVNQ